MPTDTAVLERTLIVMAICMAIQTVMFVAAGIGGFIAWRRATDAANRQIAELKLKLEHVTATLDDAATAVIRGASAVNGAVSDARESFDNVKSSVGTVAKAVAAPEAAIAMSLLRGFQFLRNRKTGSKRIRRIERVEHPAAAAQEL